MSCGYCENFDPNTDSNDNNDRREGWYGRPSGMQYELNGYVGSPQGPNAGPKTVGGTFFDEDESPSYQPVPTLESAQSTTEGWYNMIGGGQYEGNSHVSGNAGPGWGPKHAISGCLGILLNPFVLLLIFIAVFYLCKKYKKF